MYLRLWLEEVWLDEVWLEEVWLERENLEEVHHGEDLVVVLLSAALVKAVAGSLEGGGNPAQTQRATNF